MTLPGETFGETIRLLRTAKRMTLRAFAQALEVSAPYISDVEHDRRTMTDDMVAKAAVILGVDPVELGLRRRRVTKPLAEWLAKNPQLVSLLEDIRARKHRCACPCCTRIGGRL